MYHYLPVIVKNPKAWKGRLPHEVIRNRRFSDSPVFLGLMVSVGPAFAQIYRVQDMNTEQIKALDREKTVVLLPIGILEARAVPAVVFRRLYYRAPHRELANAIVERPGMEGADFSPYSLGHRPSKQGWPQVRVSRLAHRSPFDPTGHFYGSRHRLRRAGFSLDFYCEFASEP
jgi:hypothetical protein